MGARRRPEVDAGVDGVLVDLAQLVVGEVELVERGDVLLELLHAARADERRRHARVAQCPRERHLGERLAALLRHRVQRAHVGQRLLGEQVGRQRAVLLRRARVRRDAVEVLRREHPLGERREDDAAHALVLERLEQVLLDPAVQQRVRRLVDEQRRPEVAHDLRRLARAPARVRGDAGVQRLALLDRRVQRAHRLLERRLGVEAVRVEDVDVVEPHPPEALVEAREQVLARAPVAVRAGPHVVAGLRRDDQLVAERAQVAAHDLAEDALGGPVRRAVVVGQVEVRDAEVEGAAQDRARVLERPFLAEVLPQPERHLGQLDAAPAAAAIAQPPVAAGVGDVGHARDSTARPGRLTGEASKIYRYASPSTPERSHTMHDVLYWNFQSPFDREKLRRLVGWRQMGGGGGRGDRRFGPRGGHFHAPAPPFGRGPWAGPLFGGMPGGPGFGRRRRASRGDVRTAALLLLAEEPRNGYQIMQELEERTDGLWRPSPGSVYPALQQLEDEGLIRSEEADGRRLYHLTDAGLAYVAERPEDQPAPWETFTDNVSDQHGETAALMRDVAMAFAQVMRAGGEAQLAEASKVLAETRRALYRILAEGEPGTEDAE